MILKGTIYVTDREDIIYTVDLNTTKIISLDEDGILREDKNIINGTCLLPTVSCKIAEADGDEYRYDIEYSNHLFQPFQQQFIASLLAYLYIGGNLIFFLPELDSETCTLRKLIQHIYTLYGIHIGHIGNPDPNMANFYLDESCIPIWMNMIYTSRAIGAGEYLYYYPIDAELNNKLVIDILLEEINPYGKNINEKIAYIERLRKLIHKNPNVRPAIGGI